jgi:hypothetical protein
MMFARPASGIGDGIPVIPSDYPHRCLLKRVSAYSQWFVYRKSDGA